MNSLVIMKDRQAVTDSLTVAKSFEKNHRDVLRSARNLSAQNCAVKKMFFESTYINQQSHKQPMIYMNRDGFTLLAMSFTGKKALDFKLKYIQPRIKPLTPKEQQMMEKAFDELFKEDDCRG